MPPIVKVVVLISLLVGCSLLDQDDLPENLELPPMPTDAPTTTLPPVTTTTLAP